MPQPLSARRLQDALTCLDKWYGDQFGIWRRLELPDWLHADLVERITVRADAMGHRIQITRAGGVTRVWLCTERVGRVTDADVTVAARIDRIVRGALPAAA